MISLTFRASSVWAVMPRNTQTLTPKQEEQLKKWIEKDSQDKRRFEYQKKKDNPPEFDLSSGAITYIRKQVQKVILKYEHRNIDSYATRKGTEEEDTSIELYNNVFFTNHEKNVDRKYLKWEDGKLKEIEEEEVKHEEGVFYITGECDIDDDANDRIIDIKSSFSKDTFKLYLESIDTKAYEYQLRAYCMLWNRSFARLAYCLISTPQELIPMGEDPNLHYVDDIDPFLRVTTVDIERDKEIEEYMIYKMTEANRYANYFYNLVIKKNGGF